MTKAKGRARQSKRLVDMSASKDDTPPWGIDTGPVEKATERNAAHAFMDGWEAQIVVSTYRYENGGELRGFAVSLQVREESSDIQDDGAWADVVRVDTAHGMVHIDRYTSRGKRSKTKDPDGVPAECRNDLDAALRWAIGYVWDVEERVTAWKR